MAFNVLGTRKGFFSRFCLIGNAMGNIVDELSLKAISRGILILTGGVLRSFNLRKIFLQLLSFSTPYR
jgi:hypothetical protein